MLDAGGPVGTVEAMRSSRGMSMVELAVILSVLAVLGTLLFVSFRPILASSGDEQARLSVATAAALARAEAEFVGAFADPAALTAVSPLELTAQASTGPTVVSVARVSDTEMLYAALGYPGRCWVHVDRLVGLAPGWALVTDTECEAAQLMGLVSEVSDTLDEVVAGS
jgi:Tfp pilus assembly protein PilE